MTPDEPGAASGTHVLFSGLEQYEYSDLGGGLNLWIVRAVSDGPAPAVLFFFGGGWLQGTPTQFIAQGRYLASRGVNAVLVDYRVASRHGSTVRESLDDARAAFSWITDRSELLRIDRDRIAAAGGSAGGHLAAMLALSVSAPRPAALVLFNPVLLLASPDTDLATYNPPTVIETILNWGYVPEEFSPIHHLGGELPPTLILHGRSDRVVPFASVQLFQRRAEGANASCTLVGYDEQDHGFFNLGRPSNWAFLATLRRAEDFLSSLGWITGPSTLSFAVDLAGV